MWAVDRHTIERKNRTMDATYNFSLGFAQGRESITEMPNRLFNQQTLQRISTGVSLVSLSLGFSIFGVLIIVNQHQADLNDLSGGGSLATLGGIGAILVGTAFLPQWHDACCPVSDSSRLEVKFFGKLLHPNQNAMDSSVRVIIQKGILVFSI
jgi:hypothetical protein